jgi:hypothetical protein
VEDDGNGLGFFLIREFWVCGEVMEMIRNLVIGFLILKMCDEGYGYDYGYDFDFDFLLGLGL